LRAGVLHRFDKYNAKADGLVLLRAAGDRVGTRSTHAARSSHPKPLYEIAAVASSILPVLQFNVLVSDAQQYRGYLIRAWLVADQESIARSCGGYPAFSQGGWGLTKWIARWLATYMLQASRADQDLGPWGM
jgi:hypothetical protein